MAEASQSSVQVHLNYRDIDGGTERTRMLNCIRKETPSKLYLADWANDEFQTLAVANNPDQSHSAICLDVYQNHATLTVLKDVDDGVCLYSADEDTCAFRMPISSQDFKIAAILRRGDSFVFRKGRWSIHLETCAPGSSTRMTSRQISSETIAAVAETMTTTRAEAEEPADNDGIDAVPPQPPAIPYKTVVKHVNPATTTTNLESQESIGAEDRIESAVSIASGAQSDLDCTVPKTPSDLREVHVTKTPLAVRESTAGPSTFLQDEAAIEHLGHESKVTEVDEFEETSQTSKIVPVIRRTPGITKFSDFETRISPIPRTVAGISTEEAKKKSKSKQTLTPGVKRKKNGLANQLVSDEDMLRASPDPMSGNDSKSTMKKSRTKRTAAQSSPADSTRSQTSSALTPRSTNTPSRARSASLKTYRGPPPCVSFSSTTKVESNGPVMQSFGTFGGKIAKDFERANILCISKPPLKRTLKFVLSIALGKDIVTEDWLVQSHKKKGLLDVEAFLPADPTREDQWKFCLKDAVERGKSRQLNSLMKGTQVFLTQQLKISLDQYYEDFKSLINIIGGDAVGVQMPKSTDSGDDIIIVGVENDPRMALVGRLGRTMYKKDVVIMAVLRGKLELDSEEFHIEVPVKEEEAGEDDEL